MLWMGVIIPKFQCRWNGANLIFRVNISRQQKWVDLSSGIWPEAQNCRGQSILIGRFRVNISAFVDSSCGILPLAQKCRGERQDTSRFRVNISRQQTAFESTKLDFASTKNCQLIYSPIFGQWYRANRGSFASTKTRC